MSKAERMKLETANITDENIDKIGALFPNCLTEAKDEQGRLRKAIDFDKLRQELSHEVVEGADERYRFDWPEKRKATLLANTPTKMTLRPCREESVNFDTTQNLYIEGDNLEVLKLLRENYYKQVKMIYIDPPYNTGNDFVYNDDFEVGSAEWKMLYESDEEGNKLGVNAESNGRFHTDWLNMMYPRLKVAKDLLADGGVFFISIGDKEVENLRKICDEVLGPCNFIAQIPWRKRTAKSDVPFGISQDYEWIIAYAKDKTFVASVEIEKERKYYTTPDFPNRPWRHHDLTKQTTASARPNSFFTMVDPRTGRQYPAKPNRTWAITKDTFERYYNENKIIFPGDYPFLKISTPQFRYWKEDDIKKDGTGFGRCAVSTKLPDKIGMSEDGTKEIEAIFGAGVFPFPKPSSLIKYFCKIINCKDALILDFFSGSASSAHAVMQLNAEDGGDRKFIMVQLPEPCEEKGEAAKAGYKNICEIGKERIRRVGKKIEEENATTAPNLDIGFRVLKLDSSNMKDVYYNPKEFEAEFVLRDGDASLAENIKGDRTSEDLLFDVMLRFGISLSAKIAADEINGKKVFIVEDGLLMTTFDKDLNEGVITEIAKRKPVRFVMCDGGFATDNVADNFEQIWQEFSPDTVRKVI